jgi:hypothetical protein
MGPPARRTRALWELNVGRGWRRDTPGQTAGPLRSADVTPLPRYYRPSRIPLAVHRLPGVAGYTVSLLRRFLDGTRRVSPVARHDLVTVLSLPTPPKCFAASVLATLHAAFAREVRARPSGFSTFEALWVYLRYGPVTCSPSLLDGFVNRLQDSQSPSFLLFKLRGLNSYADGTFTHCSCQPSLDAHFPLLISSMSGLAIYHSSRRSYQANWQRSLAQQAAIHREQVPTAIRIPRPLMPGPPR